MPEPLDDTALLEAIAKRKDRKAFAELVQQFEAPAFHLAMHLTSRRELAEEAVQEAMLAVWFGAETFRPGGDLRKWILGIVAHRALKAVRKNSKRSKDMNWERERRAANIGERSPGEKVEQKEILDSLRSMLATLPEIERKLVALYYGAGMTQQQIGDELSMPQRTVAFKLQETLKSLRKSLAGAGLSVAPALTGKLLSESLVSGSATPSGILENTLARCDQPYAPRWSNHSARASRAAHSTRAAVGGSTQSVVAGFLLILGAATAAWWLLEPASGAAPAAAPLAASQPETYHTWRFDFENGVSPGFDFLQGDVSLRRPKPNAPMALVMEKTANNSAIFFPVLSSKRPLVVRAEAYVVSNGPLVMGMGWSDGLRVGTTRRWKSDLLSTRVGERINFTVYFIGPYVLRTGKGVLGGLSKELEDLDPKRLYFCGSNYAMESIEIQELREEDIPEEFRDLDALTNKRPGSSIIVSGANWEKPALKPLSQYLKEKQAKPTP